MRTIDLIIDILKDAENPLQQKEICNLALAHPDYLSCYELVRVKFPCSAIARTLIKFSVGVNPVTGIYPE